MKKQLFVLGVLMLCASFAEAQDVFMFVSGKKAPVAVTGDAVHQYEYWIQPNASVQHAAVTIFDAGLGGNADVIVGGADTRTTFQLFVKGKETGEPVQTLVTLNEQKYINRWFTFAALDPAVAPDGWILRVSASDGNDVNSFKINVTDMLGNTLLGKDWKLYSYDLSLSLINVPENQEVQIRPHPSFEKSVPNIRPLGEENAQISVRNTFGKNSKLPVSKDFLEVHAPGVSTTWALSVSGSAMRINNLVIRSKEKTPIMWEWSPMITQRPQALQVNVVQQPGTDCNTIRFYISEATRRLLQGAVPVWVFGDTRVDGDSALIQFPGPGSFVVTLLLPTSGIYEPTYWTSNVAVHINAPPAAVITGVRSIVSPGEELTLSSRESHNPSGKPLHLQWFVNKEFSGTESILKFSRLLPGTCEIKLLVDDGTTNSACNVSVDTKTIRVNAQPYAEINAPRVLGRTAPTKFVVKNEFDNDNDKLKYTWNGPGIVGSAEGHSIVIKQDVAGTYQICLTVDDGTGTTNSTYSTSVEYRVNPDHVPMFTTTDQIAPNDELLLKANNIMDPNAKHLTFQWICSDGFTANGAENKTTFKEPGDYTITCTLDDGEGVENSIQSYSRSIHVNAPPVPVITAVDRSTSALQSFSAEQSSDGDQTMLHYAWKFGDGSTAVGKKVMHLFQKSGRYTITLTVDDGQKQTNSIQTTEHELVINKYPIASFSAPTTWQPNVALNVDGGKSFDPDGSISGYTWLLNGKQVGTDSLVSLTFTEPGDYALALKVKDNSGFEDAVGIKTAVIHINYPPIIKWKKMPEVTEPNESVTFDATGTYDRDGKIKNVSWTFADGTTLNGLKIKKSFANTGVMTVKVAADDGAGFSNSVQSKEFTILVNNPPIIVTKTFIHSNSQIVLLDASQSYDPDGQALRFTWKLPDGKERHEASFYWNAPKGGVHFVTLIVNDGQGKKNSVVHETIKILLNRPPVAVVDTLLYSCTGQTILFNGSPSYDPDGDPMTLSWDFGDGQTASETNPAHRYNKPGFYAVKLTLNDGFAAQPTTATIPVIIEGSPQAALSFSDTAICVNTPITFDGTASVDPNGPIGSFSWDFGDGTSALGATVTHAYSKPGVYYAVITVMGNGSGRCSRVSQATATIHTVEGPIAEFTLPAVVSIGEEVLVDASHSKATGKILSSVWETTVGDSVLHAVGTQNKFVFTKAGTFEIRLTIDMETTTPCSLSTVVKNIHVNAPPVLVWNVPSDIALGELLVLDASGSYDTDGIITEYEWTFDGKKIGTTPLVTLPMTIAGNHMIALQISDNSGTSSRYASQSATVRVNSRPNPEIDIREPIYEGERTVLCAASAIDQDGDTLNYTWKIDGVTCVDNSVVLTAGKHAVTLVANDRRGLSNSIDSVQKEISITPKPELKLLSLPADFIVGATLNIAEIIGLPSVGFVTNTTMNNVWQAAIEGEQTISIGWMPRNAILSQESFAVHVWNALKFEHTPEPQTLVWNPSNPSAVLTASDVNRPESRKVKYEWRKGNTLIGYGKVVAVPLSKGVNTFTVKATDQDVVGASPVEISVVVNCE
jgi:PKD repeat protein